MSGLAGALPHSEPAIGPLLEEQRRFFASGATRPLAFRMESLRRLQNAVKDRQQAIVRAAMEDLGRPEYEGYFEIGSLMELRHTLAHLRAWARPRRAPLPLSQRPGSAWVRPEPRGVVLVLGPWNYPFQLSVSPLMGAIAAGNCVVLKPSEHAPATSRVLADLLRDTFEPAHVAVVEGGVETAQELLEHRFDHVFFTGGTAVGRLVMAAAARHLTPVTLELGGKSPCIVDRDVDLEVTARRILWGKCINAGQSCVAPDYLLVHEDARPGLLAALKAAIHDFYGEDPAASPDLGRIVNERQFDRIAALLEGERVVAGGRMDRSTRFIEPTILDPVSWEAPVMQEEIFGPILPVLTYRSIDEAIAAITARPKPLALYLFSRDRSLQERVLAGTSSGGVCLNDVFLQVAVWDLPFGGVGDSGIGAYHGRTSFDTFSHHRSVLRKPFWLDLNWRYPPYADRLGTFRRLLGLS
jgi:aldehyde dehydrogenase (NAD+)